MSSLDELEAELARLEAFLARGLLTEEEAGSQRRLSLVRYRAQQAAVDAVAGRPPPPPPPQVAAPVARVHAAGHAPPRGGDVAGAAGAGVRWGGHRARAPLPAAPAVARTRTQAGAWVAAGAGAATLRGRVRARASSSDSSPAPAGARGSRRRGTKRPRSARAGPLDEEDGVVDIAAAAEAMSAELARGSSGGGGGDGGMHNRMDGGGGGGGGGEGDGGGGYGNDSGAPPRTALPSPVWVTIPGPRGGGGGDGGMHNRMGGGGGDGGMHNRMGGGGGDPAHVTLPFLRIRGELLAPELAAAAALWGTALAALKAGQRMFGGGARTARGAARAFLI